MQFITDYIHEDNSRHMLNTLTRETFGFDFEAWVSAGFCRNSYIPYSFVEDGVMLANVSANLMYFDVEGLTKQRLFVQIGTVMTHKAYRKQGLARELMRRVLLDWADKAEDVYLFANDSAVGFYQKLGFKRMTQWQPVMHIEHVSDGAGAPYFVKCDGDNEQRRRYLSCVERMTPNAAFECVNFGLTSFYTADMEDMFYSPKLDCYALARVQDGTLYLDAVIARDKVDIARVIDGLPLSFSRVELGFTPLSACAGAFERCVYEEEDTTLFHLTDALDFVERDKLLFPLLSHA